MSILYILMILIFTSYISFITYKFGILPSISDSWYKLPQRQKILFTLFCWGFSFPIIILGDSILTFLAASGIILVGTATAFKEGLEKKVHIIGAILGVLFSQLSIYFDYDKLYVNITFITLSLIIFLIRKKLKNFIWWIEIIAFIAIVYALK